MDTVTIPASVIALAVDACAVRDSVVKPEYRRPYCIVVRDLTLAKKGERDGFSVLCASEWDAPQAHYTGLLPQRKRQTGAPLATVDRDGNVSLPYASD